MLLSVFRVPVRELPGEVAASAADADCRLLTVGSDALISTAFVRYTAGGVLEYDELIGAVLGRQGFGPRCSIPHIWVDSPQSRTGGRELWSIPKHLGEFRRDERGREVTASMTFDGEPVAALSATVGMRVLPGMPRIPLVTAQHLDGRTVVSQNQIISRVRRLSTTWTFEPSGPLGYLAGRRPTTGMALTDGSIVFGSSVRRS